MSFYLDLLADTQTEIEQLCRDLDEAETEKERRDLQEQIDALELRQWRLEERDDGY